MCSILEPTPDNDGPDQRSHLQRPSADTMLTDAHGISLARPAWTAARWAGEHPADHGVPDPEPHGEPVLGRGALRDDTAA